MLCPNCNDEMLIIEYKNVEIDFCSDCHGIWLDEGELDLLLPPETSKNSPIATALANSVESSTKGERKCPVCAKRMLLVDIPLKTDSSDLPSSVEVDKCPQNHGLWFDKGELHTITTSATGEPVSDFLSDMFAADKE